MTRHASIRNAASLAVLTPCARSTASFGVALMTYHYGNACIPGSVTTSAPQAGSDWDGRQRTRQSGSQEEPVPSAFSIVELAVRRKCR